MGRTVHLQQEVPMHAPFGSSVLTHALSVLVATIVTATLFTAVAFGLAGGDGWSLLAQAPVVAAVA
jgi:hypothetical protein